MKTHTELLTELIDAVYALHISPTIKEVHDMQMKAAEIRGQMIASNPLQNETLSPQPDADGWVENTGVDPKCLIKLIKFHDGQISEVKVPQWSDTYIWRINDNIDAITHYKPA